MFTIAEVILFATATGTICGVCGYLIGCQVGEERMAIYTEAKVAASEETLAETRRELVALEAQIFPTRHFSFQHRGPEDPV